MEIFFKDTVASNSGSWATSGDRKQGTDTNAEIDITKMTEEDDVEEVSDSSIQKPKRKNSGIDSKRGETSAEIDITKMTEEDDVEQVSDSSIQKPKRKKGGIDSKRGSVGSRLCDQFDRIIEILNRENTMAASVPTIGTCLDMLKQLPGLEYGSETHLLGIRLMKSKSNRETFVLLGDPVLQVKWIKTHTLADLSRR